MKTRKIASAFQPVQIIVEHRREANALHALFNVAAICDWLDNQGVDTEQLRRELFDVECDKTRDLLQHLKVSELRKERG